MTIKDVYKSLFLILLGASVASVTFYTSDWRAWAASTGVAVGYIVFDFLINRADAQNKRSKK